MKSKVLTDLGVLYDFAGFSLPFYSYGGLLIGLTITTACFLKHDTAKDKTRVETNKGK